MRSRHRTAGDAGRVRPGGAARHPDGSLVRLKDVARIELGAQTYDMRGRLNGKPSDWYSPCYQLPGTNAIQRRGRRKEG